MKECPPGKWLYPDDKYSGTSNFFSIKTNEVYRFGRLNAAST
jgi:hypothetical protein